MALDVVEGKLQGVLQEIPTFFGLFNLVSESGHIYVYVPLCSFPECFFVFQDMQKLFNRVYLLETRQAFESSKTWKLLDSRFLSGRWLEGKM